MKFRNIIADYIVPCWELISLFLQYVISILVSLFTHGFHTSLLLITIYNNKKIANLIEQLIKFIALKVELERIKLINIVNSTSDDNSKLEEKVKNKK
jgi:hypothetical protein